MSDSREYPHKKQRSEQADNTLSAQLQRSERQQSPIALDRDILKAARLQAAHNARHHRASQQRWLGLAAAASVACIGVMLVVQSPQPEMTLEPAVAPVRELLQDSATPQSSPTMMSSPAAKPKAKTATAIPTDSEEPRKRESRSQGFALEEVVVTARKRRDDNPGKMAGAADRLDVDSEIRKADGERQLSEIIERWRRGEHEAAEADYRALRGRCPRCELPETLADYLPTLEGSP